MPAVDRAALAVQVFEFDLLVAAAEQHQILDVLRQLFERRLDVELGMPRQRLNQLKIIGVAPIPATHRAAGEGQVRIADDFVRIEEFLRAQAVASGAGADGTVEGKQPRFEFAQGIIADRAGELVGEHQLRARRIIHVGDARDALPQAQRGFKRLGQALAQIRAHFEAIHDGLDAVLAAHVELGRLIQFHDLAVDSRTDESPRLQFIEEFGVLALAFGDGRCEQHHGGAFRMLQHRVHHLAHRLRGEIDVMIRATRRAGTRVQQPKIVIDLGDRAHRGARIVRSRFLLDGDGRRQTFNGVDVGLLHHRQELPGVGRQRFHIAALAFRIDGVEGQRGFPGTRQAGQHDEPISRQVEIDILQIVGPGTPDSDILHVTDYYTRGVKRGYIAPGRPRFRAANCGYLPLRGAPTEYWGASSVYNTRH